MIDIHNHILPGLDDGARDWDEAIKLCELAKADGIEAIAVTPHIRDGLYPNNRDKIIEKTNELREKIANRVDIDIYAGAEVHIAMDLPEKIKRGEIPGINEKGYLLLELPEHLLPPRIDDMIFDLKLARITPIIAHPERCTWATGDTNDFERLKRFIDQGALVQLTALSLTGGFGRNIKKISTKMLKLGLIDVIASDSHSPTHRPPKLSAALEAAQKIIGEEKASRLVKENPEKIIKGEPIERRS